MLFQNEPTKKGEDVYSKAMKKVKEEIGSMAKDSNNPIIRKVNNKKNNERNETDIKRNELARAVFYEGLEEWEEGEYSWEDTIKNITSALKKIK